MFRKKISKYPFTLEPARALPGPVCPANHTGLFLLSLNSRFPSWVQSWCHKEAESKMLKLIVLLTSVRVLKSLVLWAQHSRSDSGFISFSGSLDRAKGEPWVCVGFTVLPGLLHEDFEAIRAGGRNRKMQAVTAHSPNDGWGVHILVGNLSC